MDEKGDKYLDLAKRAEEAMEHEDDGDTNCSWGIWNDIQRIVKGTGRLRNQRTSWNHPDYSIIMIGRNTEKSPGDLRRLAVSHTPVKDHQLMFMWKILKVVK